ncbi:hypothetical protein D3C80_2185680 [compost metagenome]
MMPGNHCKLFLQAAACLELHIQLLEEPFAITAGDSEKQLFLAFKIQIDRPFGDTRLLGHF